jgi:hypothetical protein
MYLLRLLCAPLIVTRLDERCRVDTLLRSLPSGPLGICWRGTHFRVTYLLQVLDAAVIPALLR